MMNAAIEESRQLYTLEQAGRLLGCSHWLLRRHIEQGAVRPTRLGRLVRLSAE
jgi:excisionase family DNA binding protein